jgi:hypothetical protein
MSAISYWGLANYMIAYSGYHCASAPNVNWPWTTTEPCQLDWVQGTLDFSAVNTITVVLYSTYYSDGTLNMFFPTSTIIVTCLAPSTDFQGLNTYAFSLQIRWQSSTETSTPMQTPPASTTSSKLAPVCSANCKVPDGEKVGIGVAVVVGALLGLAGVWYIRKRRKASLGTDVGTRGLFSKPELDGRGRESPWKKKELKNQTLLFRLLN